MRSALPSANTNRFLKNRTKLTAITEELPEEEEKEEGAYIHRHDLAREFDALERDEDLAYRKHAIRRDEDDSMDWDDESTLVAMLQETYVGMQLVPNAGGMLTPPTGRPSTSKRKWLRWRTSSRRRWLHKVWQ